MGVTASCSQHLWETLKKNPTHNKELNEESDLCINKLNSCFDNSCYKKFADKTAWILTFPISWLARNFCLIGTCFGQYYIQVKPCTLLPNCTYTKKLLLITYQLLVLIFDLYNCKSNEALVKQNWYTNCTYRALVCTNHNTN